MRLIDLINTTPTSDIITECARIDETNGDVPYRHVLDKLAELAPGKADFAIMLSPYDEGEGRILDVSGVHEGDPQSYGIEFCPWEEWLDADVRFKGVDLTPAQMVAQCLYEMTFIGFDQEEIQDRADQMHEMVEDIMEGRVELVELDLDKPDEKE